MATKITPEDRELIIKIARLFIDSPYMFWWNGDLPWDPTDCSRFIQVVLENVWIKVERNSAMQWEQSTSTWNMIDNLDGAEMWDLIFYKNTYETKNEITHVGFYMWNNEMINATWVTKKVCISKIDKYRKEHFKW
jgi:cell wall-associated NlpC family hydrolase